MEQQTKQYDIIKIPPEIFLYQPEGTKGNPAVAKLVERVDFFPPEGGMLTYYPNGLFPQKGCPAPFIHDKLNETKELPMIVIKLISESLLAKIFVFFVLLLPEKQFKKLFLKIMRQWVFFAFMSTRNTLVDPKRYCKSGREIFRVLQIMISRRNKSIQKLLTRFSYVVCQIWEFDQHYRTIFQDMFYAIKMGLINKEDILKDPLRLLDLPIERDVMEDRRNQWKKIRQALKILMFFRGKLIKRIFNEFMSELNIEEVAFDDGDLWYYLPYEAYNFLGISRFERANMRQQLFDKYTKK